MEKESLSARQQDTNKLKEGLWKFFAYEDVNNPVVPRDKTGRGFNHIVMARALCPRAYIWDFDNDEGCVFLGVFIFLTFRSSFLERITSGDIMITADQLPNFLYDKTMADVPSRDEDWNVENGLLCSDLCLWVCCFIFWSRLKFIWKHAGIQMYFHG